MSTKHLNHQVRKERPVNNLVLLATLAAIILH